MRFLFSLFVILFTFSATAQFRPVLSTEDHGGSDSGHSIRQRFYLSPDNRYAIVSRGDSAYVWDMENGGFVCQKSITRKGFSCSFSAASDRMVMWDGRDASIFSLPQGKWLADLKTSREEKILDVMLEPTGKYAVVQTKTGYDLWNIAIRRKIYSRNMMNVKVTYNGEMIYCNDNYYRLETGKLISDVASEQPLAVFTGSRYKLSLSKETFHNGKAFAVANESGTPLVYVIMFKGTDFVVMDKAGHFDGSAIGRAQLKIACQQDLLTPEEMNKLYVPGLAKRIMRGEVIKSKKISDLKPCND